jgi:CRISPR/Cas system-associated endoribonuclease Cas2
MMMAVQYSVFYAELTQVQTDNLLAELGAVIDPREDKINLYQIKGVEHHVSLGPTLQSAGIYIFHETGLMH